jgi:hypothetical protein
MNILRRSRLSSVLVAGPIAGTVIALLFAAGCGRVEPKLQDADIEPDASPDAAPSLGCPVGCLPPAPEGWSGPSAVYDGPSANKPAECVGAYSDKQIETHVGMTAGPATCSCGTATVSGRGCNATIGTYPQNGCAGLGLSEGTVSTSACKSTTNGTMATYRVENVTLVAGTCNYPNATRTLPDPTFDKVEVACGLAQASACVGRADCVATPTPTQPYERVCIHQAGDVPCPNEDYGQRFVAYKSIDDTRSCSACPTTTPTGGACGTSWGNRASTTQCTNFPPPSDKTAGTCYSYPGIGTVVDIGAMAPSAGTCTPTGGQPSGAASSADPVTYCCNS